MAWVRVAGASHVGCIRANNEDRFESRIGADPAVADLVLCDGMGGMGNGAEAARVGTRSLLAALGAARPNEADRALMRRALVHTDVVVREALCTADRFPGCAAVAIRLRPHMATVGWVGDCRAYLVRASRVVARTRDHRFTEDLVTAGEITPEEARVHPAYNVLTRAIGGRPVEAPPTTPTVLQWTLEPGDRIVMCSDGLWDLVEDHELAHLAGAVRLDSLPEVLVDHALSRGGHDNTTALVAAVTRTPGPVATP